MPWAVRHEPGYKWLVGFGNPAHDVSTAYTGRWIIDADQNWWLPDNPSAERATTITELLFQQSSWGLMQIMGAVARERGFGGWLTELCDPTVNMEWGCRHLRWMLDHPLDYGLSIAQGPAVLKGTLADLAAAWNGGARVVMDGKYKNQPYVDRVLRAMEGYQ